MEFPRAIFKLTTEGLQEKLVHSQDEYHAVVYKKGWYPEPHEARLAGIEETEAHADIDAMNKAELCEHAATFGIELDRRQSLENMKKAFTVKMSEVTK